MSNMSYCRFENTYNDLKDCLNALNEGDIHDMSQYEKKALKSLVKLCTEISEQYGEEGQIDEMLAQADRDDVDAPDYENPRRGPGDGISHACDDMPTHEPDPED